jgi:hypothetical protein
MRYGVKHFVLMGLVSFCFLEPLEADIMYDTGLSMSFGSGMEPVELTMEGANAEVQFQLHDVASLGDHFRCYRDPDGALAVQLPRGAPIDSSNNTPNAFGGTGALAGFHGYLGVSFELEDNAQAVYGWIGIASVSDGHEIRAWGYEDGGGAINAGAIGPDTSNIVSVTGLSIPVERDGDPVELTMEGANAEVQFQYHDVSSLGDHFRWYRDPDGPLAVPLSAGDVIDWLNNTPNAHGGTGALTGFHGYLGVSFDLEDSGQTAYGWIEVAEITDGYEIRGWGYEATGNPISAGDVTPIPLPSSLAMGLLGVLSSAIVTSKGKCRH